MVNVVSEHALKRTSSDGGDAAANFMKQIREPAIKMVKLYLAQAALTFGYIYSLSCVGSKNKSLNGTLIIQLDFCLQARELLPGFVAIFSALWLLRMWPSSIRTSLGRSSPA